VSSANAKPTPTSSAANKLRLGLAEIARVYFGVAGSTWGSGSVTVVNIRNELVDRRAVLSEPEFTFAYAMARLAPGTNVLAFCAATGWRLAGWPGAVAAVTALSIPAAVVCVLLTLAYGRWPQVFAGAMAAVVGVICAGAFLLVRPYLGSRKWFRTLVLLAGALAAVPFVGPVWVMLLAGAAGYLWRDL
jgi:chromate transporter